MSSPSQPSISLTKREAETRDLVSGFIARCTIFTFMAVQNAYSWHAGSLYRLSGYLTPRWRGTILTIHSFLVLLSMPGNLRMIKITSLAARGYLPWNKAVFEWLWDGSAILVWSATTWAVYRFAASISLSSLPLLLMKAVVARIGLFIFLSVCAWTLTIIYPSIWAGVDIRPVQLYVQMLDAIFHSPFGPILGRISHVHGGFLIKNYKRYIQRSGDAFRNQRSLEGLVQGLAEYQYDGLQGGQFRLVKITRPWVMAPFECTLLVFDLHDTECPAYTAVSYEWGPNSEVRPFNLRIGDRQLAVTESAYRVVCGLAPESGDRYIWCDFVCINQNDWDERASQVKLMKEIYAGAANVAVFLNTASAVDYDVCDLASHHLQKINESLKQPQWDMNRQWARFNKIDSNERGSLGWQALAKIFERQYWSRAWVVQEIVLAKRLVVIYGDNEFRWDELVSIAEAFQDRGNDGSLDVTGTLLRGVDIPFVQITMLLRVSRIRDAFHRCGGPSFREVMSYGPRFNATDPRDNIFAFQGLCCESVPPSMQPDYRIRPVDLYVNSVREIMTEGLWFLNFAGIGWGKRSLESRIASISDEELPSWTPNWGQTVNKNDLPKMHNPVQRAELRPTLHEEIRTLSVYSAAFSNIVKVTNFPLYPGPESGFSPGSLSTDTLPESAKAAKEFQEDMETLVPVSYPTGIDRDDALWRLLLGDIQRDRDEIERLNDSLALWISQNEYGSYVLSLVGSNGEPKADNGDAHELTEKLTKMFAAADRLNKEGGEFAAQKSPQESLNNMSASQLETCLKTSYVNSTRFLYELGRHSVGRKVAFTQSGHMILAPPLAAVGDEVRFLAFAETPFVFRQISNEEQGNGEYPLVGDCELYNAQDELDKLSEFKELIIV